MSADYTGRVADVCEKFKTLDIDTILSCFSEEVTVNYNFIEINGKQALRAFLTPRYQRLEKYQLIKKIIMQENNRAVVEVQARYYDREEKQYYQSKIIEVLHFQQDAITRWEYVGTAQTVAS
jgi:nuclear transport factor 2 (NTF2) superfamily protein